MKVTILKEAGYEEALLGLSLSFNRPWSDMVKVSKGLYNKDGGHNKFLESIYVWLDVTAPRYWWAEGDTYRLSTKQSESTIHTGMKRVLTKDDFEGGEIPEDYLYYLNLLIETKDFLRFKRNLPESFLQRRIWNMNYKTLRNILWQRKGHKLPEWGVFFTEVLSNIEHKEYFKDIVEGVKYA